MLKTKQFPFVTLSQMMFLVFFVSWILGMIQCAHVTKEDKIVKEDNNYIYVMTYDPFNMDSVLVKYHKPVVVETKMIDKSKEKYHTVTMQNVKNGQKFEYRDKDVYKTITNPRNKNKTYKFKYTYYPKSKEGYEFVK